MTALPVWFAKRPLYQRNIIVFLLGVLAAASMAPFHLVFVLPVSFVGLLLGVMAAQNKKQAFFVGWLFGWGYFIAGLYWIGVAFTIDANAHAALMPIPVFGLPAFLACFIGLTTFLCYFYRTSWFSLIVIFTSSWVSMEILRGYLFTGFPWNMIGYTWLFSDQMSQITSVFGTVGLSFYTVFVCSLPFIWFEKNIGRKALYLCSSVVAVALILQYAYGEYRLIHADTKIVENVKLRIVQPNIRQQDKWKRHLRQLHVQKLVELSSQAGAESITHLVWPETSVPYFLTTNQRVADYIAAIIPPKGALITGAPRKALEKRQYWNSMIVMSDEGTFPDVYDKHHLVPYGEYMPLRTLLKALGLFALIPALDNMSDFDQNDDKYDEIVSVPGLPDARGLICYEVAFATEIDMGKPFSWILNLTNDGWFGDTTGPYQHLVTTQARALEQGVPVVRAANTGISALIDPYGRIVSSLRLNEQGVLDVSLPKALLARPIYSFFEIWFHMGFLLINACMLILLRPNKFKKQII